MNVLAGRKVHDGIAAPADRPGHFLHFFANRGTQRRVADIGVDLHQKVPADDHRLGFRMVDVCRDDRAAASDLVTYEFGRYFGRDVGAKTLATMLPAHEGGQFSSHRPGRLEVFQVLGAPEALTNGDEFHFRRNDSFSRVVHLRHVPAGFGATGIPAEIESQLAELRIGQALHTETRTRARQRLAIAAFGDPACAKRLQPRTNIDLCSRVRIGSGSVVNPERRVLFGTEIGRGVRL